MNKDSLWGIGGLTAIYRFSFMMFLFVVIIPRQIGRGTACAGADMGRRDSSGRGLKCYGEKTML